MHRLINGKIRHLRNHPDQQRLLDEQFEQLDPYAGQDPGGKYRAPTAQACQSDVLPVQAAQAQRGPCQEKQVGCLAEEYVVAHIRHENCSYDGEFASRQQFAITPGTRTGRCVAHLHQGSGISRISNSLTPVISISLLTKKFWSPEFLTCSNDRPETVPLFVAAQAALAQHD